MYLEQYKILAELNRKAVFAEEISSAEKEQAISVFLSGIRCKEDILKYKKCMNVNPETDHMYPDYYIPPCNGYKKLRLIQGYLPKTNILYANHYELESIRLLSMFAPEHEKVNELAENTLYRLSNTCFGNFCAKGECTATGISVLRFLAVTRPDDSEWIDKLLIPLGDIFLTCGNGRAAMQKGLPLSYLLMAFIDINNEKTKSLIAQKKDWLLELQRRGRTTGKSYDGELSEEDRYNLMGRYIIKRATDTLE